MQMVRPTPFFHEIHLAVFEAGDLLAHHLDEYGDVIEGVHGAPVGWLGEHNLITAGRMINLSSREEMTMLQRSWFWDRLAKRYAKTPIADQASYEIKLEKTRALLRPDSRVLEFGCGTGSTAILHAPHVSEILAIDYSARMLDIARERARAAGVKNLNFRQATLAELDSPAGCWDVILGMSILHLLPDRAQTMARVHELLKPGAVFISSTICIGDAAWPMRVLAPVFRALPLLPGIASFTLEQLKDELKRAGFEIEACWRPGENKAAFIVARKRGADT